MLYNMLETNCYETMTSHFQGPVGCLPICYRTDEKCHSFQGFKYRDSGEQPTFQDV